MTETRTYVGLTGTQAFDGHAGLRIGQRYTGVVQDDGQVLVLMSGTRPGSSIRVTAEQWKNWFKK